MNKLLNKPSELMNYSEKTEVKNQLSSQKIITITKNCPIHGKQEIKTFAFRADQAKCPACNLAEAMQRKQQNIAQIKRQNALDGGINVKYYDMDYTAWQTPTPKQQKILNFVQTWANDFNRGSENILLLGNTGTGKTMLASIAASHISDKGFKVRMLRSSEIAEQARDAWAKNTKVTEKDLLDSWINCDLLVIDEFGEGDIAENNSTMAKQDRERLSKIIDGRYSAGKPIIFTSNLDKDEFRIRIADRAWDRVQQNAVLVVCNWQSYRRQTSKLVEL